MSRGKSEDTLPAPAFPPSVLYDDDLSDRPEGLFLSGEIDLCADIDQFRDLILRWRGIALELRPQDTGRLAKPIAEFVESMRVSKAKLEALADLIDGEE